MRKKKGKIAAIFALLAVAVVASGGAYYYFINGQISASTVMPPLPSVANLPEDTSDSSFAPPVPGQLSTNTELGNADQFTDESLDYSSSQSTDNYSTVNGSDDASLSYGVGNTQVASNITSTPIANTTASVSQFKTETAVPIGAVAQSTITPFPTFTPEAAASSGANAKVIIFALVALGAIGALAFVLLKKKPSTQTSPPPVDLSPRPSESPVSVEAVMPNQPPAQAIPPAQSVQPQTQTPQSAQPPQQPPQV